jgi:hypothetical protein
MVKKDITIPITSARDGAKLLIQLKLPKLKKFIYQNISRKRNNLFDEYDRIIKDYFKLNPTFEKLTKKTEFNSNGDCSAFIKYLINVT